jgi:hypothetical protein
MEKGQECVFDTTPRVVALLAHSGHEGHERHNGPECNAGGQSACEGCWGDEQAGRLRAWLGVTAVGGGLLIDPACPLADEGVGRSLTELVRRRLVEKGVQQQQGGGENDLAAEMTIGQYIATFPHLRASDREALASPSALVPPVRIAAYMRLLALLRS